MYRVVKSPCGKGYRVQKNVECFGSKFMWVIFDHSRRYKWKTIYADHTLFAAETYVKSLMDLKKNETEDWTEVSCFYDEVSLEENNEHY
jgi:hypothetical protein